MSEEKQYYAFISYKREDKKDAKRLQHQLEYYRLPNQLRRDNPDLPEYVRPVFRDMTDLEVGELSTLIHEALEQSHYLIVVCSPRAAKSKWVNDEVEYFISLGKQDKIIPYIIEGVPHADDPSEECYPPALLQLSKEKELLGANINEVGKEAAGIRIVAKMFGIRYDTLYQRYQREKKRKKWFLGSFVSLFLLFLIGGSWILWQQNLKLKKSNWKIKETSARYIAKMAEQLIDEEDSYSAISLCLEVLPTKEELKQKPYTIEAESALRKASINMNAKLRGAESEVSSITISPNDQYIVAGLFSGDVCVWHSMNGGLLNKYSAHLSGVTDIEFIDDNHILTSSYDKTLKIWNLESGELETSLMFSNKIPTKISVSRDMKLLFVAFADGKIGVYNSMTLDSINSINAHNQGITHILSTSSYIVTAHTDATIKIWDISTYKCVHTFSDMWSASVALSIDPTGKFLISVGHWDDYIRIWNIKTGKHQELYRENESRFTGVTFSNDGRYVLATLENGYIRIIKCDYNSGKSKLERSIHEYPNSQNIIRIGHHNNFYATKSSSNTISLRNYIHKEAIDTSLQIYGSKATNDIVQEQKIYWSNVAYNSDGKLLAFITKDSMINIREVSSGMLRFQVPASDREVIFSPHGDEIAQGGKKISIWNISTGQLVHTINTPSNPKLITYSNTGTQLAVINNGAIMVYDVASEEIINVLKPTDAPISSLAFGKDDKSLLITYKDTISVIEIPSNKILKKIVGHEEYILHAIYTIDGKYIISCSKDGTVKIWDSQTLLLLLTLPAYVNAGSRIFVMKNNCKIFLESMYGLQSWDFPDAQSLIMQMRDRFKDRELTPEERRKYYLE